VRMTPGNADVPMSSIGLLAVVRSYAPFTPTGGTLH
jgi:hypothetical protein